MLIILAARLLCMLEHTDSYAFAQEANARKCSCDPLRVPCNFKDLHCSLRDNCNSSKENVALGKDTRFRSVFQMLKHRGLNLGSLACLAVNGNIDPHYKPPRLHESTTNSNCYRSGERDLTPYWEVDLGRTYTVSEITIVVDSAHKEVMLNVEVYVNNRLCYKFTSVTIVDPYMIHISCDTPVSGRIVKLSKRSPPYTRLTPDIMLSFCEVQVWVCNHGLYGRNCDKKCSKSCNNCDNYNGECESCETGYYGIYCTELCRCSNKGCNKDGICYEIPTTPATTSVQSVQVLSEATKPPQLPGSTGLPETQIEGTFNTIVIVIGVVAGICVLCFIAGGLYWYFKNRTAAGDDYTKIPQNACVASKVFGELCGDSKRKGSKRRGSSINKGRSSHTDDLNISGNRKCSTRYSNGWKRKGSSMKKGRSRHRDDFIITENRISSNGSKRKKGTTVCHSEDNAVHEGSKIIYHNKTFGKNGRMIAS